MNIKPTFGKIQTLVRLQRSTIWKAEGFTDRFVSRMVRLAFLSPDVLERLVISRDPPSVAVNGLVDATYQPWADQGAAIYVKRKTSGLPIG